MLRAYGVDELLIVRYKGKDTRGEPLTKSHTEVNGYVEWKFQLVRDFAGEEIVSRGHAFIVYDGTIDNKDRMLINDKEYVIVALEPAKDFSNVGLKVYIV